MANLQYIGARYVPKFYENSQDPSSMEWESGVGYEPLTVVTYQDDTYTSKIPVPSTVGNPADNPNYWAKTGNYNAAIESLQQEVSNITNNTIPTIIANARFANVKDFGAKGDGVTHDGGAIRAAIDHCNTTGQTLYFPKGTYIYDYDVPQHVLCDIDFNNSTIILYWDSDPSIDAFIVLEDREADKTINSSIITHTSINDSDLYGKAFLLATPISLGLRGGDGAEYFYQRYVIIDGNGNITNGEIEPDIIAGSYGCKNIRDIDENGVTIENAIVTVKSATATVLPRFLHVLKNNTVIRNIGIDYPPINNSSFNLGIVCFTRCCNCVIDGLHGLNPYGTDNAGYMIDLTECYNITVKDFIGIDKNGYSWGSIGTNYSFSTHFINCIMQRVDSHMMGDYTADNCTIQYGNFSGGYGHIELNNCDIVYTHAGSNSGNIYHFRRDLQYLMSGKILFNNCRIKNNTNDTVHLVNIVLNRSPYVDPEAIGYNGLDIEFVDCNIGEKITLLYTDIWEESYADGLTVNMIRCDISGASAFNGGGSTYYKKSFKAINCNFLDATNGLFCGANRFNKLDFIDCYIAGELICNNVNPMLSKISIINCVLNGVSLRSENILRIIGCDIEKDVVPTIYGTPLNSIKVNNIISDSTKVNEASWNT